MLQAYKEDIRYWFAVRFGSLETASEEHISEIICPDCGMKTTLDSRVAEEQSCYFCDGDLRNDTRNQAEVERERAPARSNTNAPQKVAN